MLIKTIFLGLCLLAALAAAADPATAGDPVPDVDPADTQLAEGSQLMRFIKAQWNNFRAKHKRTYSTLLEAAKRFKIFVQNVRAVLRHNQLFKKGGATFEQQTTNQFADLTSAEFLQQRSLHNVTLENPNRGPVNETAETDTETDSDSSPERSHRSARATLPWEVNWVTQGAVSPIQDQGQCGSCWAFTVAGAVEGWQWRKSGVLTPLSPQQLLDCTGRGNDCNSGFPARAFEYVRTNYGLSPASAYPYYKQQGQCYNVYRVGTIQSFAFTRAGDELDVMRALSQYGPLSIAIDITPQSFQFYSGGVWQGQGCRKGYTNHIMLLVGYGRDEATGLDYWLVKNSWGTQWGEQGYVRMLRYARNNENCNLADYAIYPTA